MNSTSAGWESTIPFHDDLTLRTGDDTNGSHVLTFPGGCENLSFFYRRLHAQSSIPQRGRNGRDKRRRTYKVKVRIDAHAVASTDNKITTS